MTIIPKVKFKGRIVDDAGEPCTGMCFLQPENDVIEIGEEWITTSSYEVPLKDGYFNVNVLPTNVGVDSAWSYIFHTPIKSYIIQLPAGGAHDFDAMLLKHKSEHE